MMGFETAAHSRRTQLFDNWSRVVAQVYTPGSTVDGKPCGVTRYESVRTPLGMRVRCWKFAQLAGTLPTPAASSNPQSGGE